MVAVCAVIMAVTPCASYAKVIELPFCKDDLDPTIRVVEGKSGMSLFASIKGVRVKGIELPKELQMYPENEELKDVIILDDKSSKYNNWKLAVINFYGKTEKARNVVKPSWTNMHVMAKCSSQKKYEWVLNNGKPFACPAGDSITFSQDYPESKDPENSPRTVIAIEETDMEKLKKELELINLEKEKNKEKVKQLQEENIEIKKKMDQIDDDLEKQADRLFGKQEKK